MHAAWTHPETLKIVSDIAGVDLVPVMDYEIGTVLVASTPESVLEARRASNKSGDAEGKVTNWHKDHYPFVCVVMMSDVSGMKGGETAIRTSEGEVQKIRGPQMASRRVIPIHCRGRRANFHQGCATVMQGRHIEHQALAAEGGRERISMVTSFRPRDTMMIDDSHLKYITRVTDPSELYYQFTDYRLEILEERIRRTRAELSSRKLQGGQFDLDATKSFLRGQIDHLSVTSDQIVPYHQVLSGKVFNGLEIRGSV